VIAKRERRPRRCADQPAVTSRSPPLHEAQHGEREQQGSKRVDLGEDRLRPERLPEARRDAQSHCREATHTQPDEHDREHGHSRSREHGGKQIHPVRERADRHIRKDVRQQHEERVARIVRRAEDVADELELGGVARADHAGIQRAEVDDKCWQRGGQRSRQRAESRGTRGRR
jgi:hypothetical protein